MKPVEMYLKPSCTTCRDAVAWFDERGIELQKHDFAKEPPSREELERWVRAEGLDVVFNRRSRTFKDLGLASKQLDESAAIDWMSREPNLIKRPVVLIGKQRFFGFVPDQYAEALKA